MSAIFGIIYKQKPATSTVAKAMQDVLRHRATDGAGIYEDENAIIGNHQLITSVYQRNKPVLFEKFNCVITCDSRLDNRDSLIQLLALDKKKTETSDNELILEAYQKWNKACTNYLEGEFAFVIWNKETKTVFAATDHIGFRSFYYCITDEAFIFSSEIKGIQVLKETPGKFNSLALVNYIKNNFDGSTFDNDIRQLGAASHLSYQCHNNSTPVVTQYWTLQKQGKYQFRKDADWAECAADLLVQSVRNRLCTDKPVSISFSGGLDSSFLAGILARELAKQNKPLYTISHVLPDDYQGVATDERYYIELLAKKYPNVIQKFVHFPESLGPFTDMEDTFERTEILSYPIIYVDKGLYSTAQQLGTGLCFTGFGGDFAISSKGNGMIYEMIKERQYEKMWHYFMFLKKHDNLSFLNATRLLILEHSFLDEFLLLLKSSLKSNRIRLNDNLLKIAKKKRIFGSGGSVKERFAGIINTGTLGGILFSTQKKLSSSYGLECTTPMLDRHLCEFFMDTPPEQFLLNNHNRSLMRRAMQDYVPEEIQWRKDKYPFSPNFIDKFRESKTLIDEILTDNRYQNARKYINLEALKSDCNELFAGKGTSADYRFAAWSITLISFLFWLEKKNYSI